jgi:hypothetical protein
MPSIGVFASLAAVTSAIRLLHTFSERWLQCLGHSKPRPARGKTKKEDYYGKEMFCNVIANLWYSFLLFLFSD